MNFTTVPIERVRSYWDDRPCNIRHSTAPIGTRLYFDEVEARKYRVEPHIPVFADFAAWDGKSVLEIGCGIGTDTINFAAAGAEVTATDLSKKSLELTRQRASVYGQVITTLHVNAEYLDRTLFPQTFDLVYSFGVIHHSPHPEEILRQARLCSGSGTKLKIMVYNRRSWKVAWIIARYGHGRFWDAGNLIAKHSEAQTGCPVTYAYTRKEITRLVEDAGFTVDSTEVDHIFSYRIPDYVNYRFVKTWYWRLVPGPVFRWLERRAGWHLMVNAHG